LAGAVGAAGVAGTALAVDAVVGADIVVLAAFAVEPVGFDAVTAAELTGALAVCSVFMVSLFAPGFASTALLETWVDAAGVAAGLAAGLAACVLDARQ